MKERVAFYELVGKVLRPSSSVGGCSCEVISTLVWRFGAQVTDPLVHTECEDSNEPFLRAFTDEHELVFLTTQCEDPHAT